MKNVFKTIAMVMLVAVIGFSLISCSDSGGSGSGSNTTTTVKVPPVIEDSSGTLRLNIADLDDTIIGAYYEALFGEYGKELAEEKMKDGGDISKVEFPDLDIFIILYSATDKLIACKSIAADGAVQGEDIFSKNSSKDILLTVWAIDGKDFKKYNGYKTIAKANFTVYFASKPVGTSGPVVADDFKELFGQDGTTITGSLNRAWKLTADVVFQNGQAGIDTTDADAKIALEAI